MNKKLKYLILIALFSALSMLLTLIRVPLPIFPSFYKLDFSESIVILGGYLLGPFASILIQLLKNLLKILFSSTNSMFVGDVANFIMGVAFVLPAAIIYKKNNDNKHVIISLIVGMVSLVIVSCFVNYFIVIPAYSVVYKMPLEAIISMGTKIIPAINSLFTFVIFATAPFNLLKGLLNALIAYFVYNRTKKVFFKK